MFVLSDETILKPPARGTCMQGFEILPAPFKAIFSEYRRISKRCV